MPAPRNDAKADAMFELYRDGFSLSQVAKAFNTTRQSVHKMFAKRGFELRSTQPLPFLMWGGAKYSIRSHGYYARTDTGRTYMHRDVWKSHNGAIPDGFDIHHKDEDKSNNAINNLEMLSKVDHGEVHSTTNENFKASQFKSGRKGTHYPRKDG